MRNDDQKAAVRRKLKALMDAVIDQAIENPEFMNKLESILVRPGEEFTDRSLDRTTASRKAAGPNLLEILHTNGEAAVQQALEEMTTDELVRTCVQEGIRKQKEAKALERSELIVLLVEMTSNRLRQGGSFVRSGA